MAMSFAEIYFDVYFLGYLLVQFAAWAVLTRMLSRTKHFGHNAVDGAHQFVALGSFTWLGLSGAFLWFFDPEFAMAFEEDKLFGFYEPARMLIHGMIGFMVFDTACLVAARAGPEFYVHHSLVLILANFGLMYDENTWFMLYYGVFFFGVSELSSIPLGFVDMFRGNKQLAEAYPKLNDNFRTAFALAFLSVRIAYWPFVMYDFCANFFPRLGEMRWAPAFAFGATAVILTLLQWLWGGLIIMGIVKLAQGKPTTEMDQAVSERGGTFASLVG